MACASKLDTAGTVDCVSWLRPQHAASGLWSLVFLHDDPGGPSLDLRSCVGVKIIRESFVPEQLQEKEKKRKKRLQDFARGSALTGSDYKALPLACSFTILRSTMLWVACQLHQPVHLVQETAPKSANGLQGRGAKKAGSRAW